MRRSGSFLPLRAPVVERTQETLAAGGDVAAAYLDGAIRGEDGLQNLPVLIPERRRTPNWWR